MDQANTDQPKKEEGTAENFSCIARGKISVVKNLDELGVFADSFLEFLSATAKNSQNGSVIVGLSGDLGAGKTTFSQTVARKLGIQEVVVSPTFVIQKSYAVEGGHLDQLGTFRRFVRFVHIDAYRIERPDEMKSLRFDELVQSLNTLIFIEWPEKIAGILPKDIIMLSFESIDENTRKISY